MIGGFKYEPDFLSIADEARLLDEIRGLEFHEIRMRGVTAKRRVIQYGWHYSFESFKLTEAAALPGFLIPVRERAAELAGLQSEVLSEALLTEYQAGAAIGWHRDAPPFDVVIGISLLAPARFRFRRGEVRAWETKEIVLEPRSAYVLTGPARSQWQHSIPPMKQLRYSITFRTLRKDGRSAAR